MTIIYMYALKGRQYDTVCIWKTLFRAEINRGFLTFIEITCRPLAIPENGITLNGKLKAHNGLGETVVLGCSSGYKMVGEGSLECLPTGLWSADLPKCEPISCKKHHRKHSDFYSWFKEHLTTYIVLVFMYSCYLIIKLRSSKYVSFYP